jgi:hypothetical protein
VWNEVLQLLLPDSCADAVLEFEVHDSDKSGKDEFLGMLQFRGNEILQLTDGGDNKDGKFSLPLKKKLYSKKKSKVRGTLEIEVDMRKGEWSDESDDGGRWLPLRNMSKEELQRQAELKEQSSKAVAKKATEEKKKAKSAYKEKEKKKELKHEKIQTHLVKGQLSIKMGMSVVRFDNEITPEEDDEDPKAAKSKKGKGKAKAKASKKGKNKDKAPWERKEEEIANGGSASGDANATGSSTPIRVMGLKNGAAYSFAVRSRNSEGFGPYSVLSRPCFIPPIVPTRPHMTELVPGDRWAEVHFDPPVHDGGEKIKGFTVIVLHADQPIMYVSGTASPIRLAGLENGQVYAFKMYAVNRVGDGPMTVVSEGVVPSEEAAAAIAEAAAAAAAAAEEDAKAGLPILLPPLEGGGAGDAAELVEGEVFSGTHPALELELQVVRAKGLGKADTFGKSDPYAVVFWCDGEWTKHTDAATQGEETKGGKAHATASNAALTALKGKVLHETGRTAVIQNCLDPEWASEFFRLHMPSGVGGAALRVEVYDKDSFGTDTFLGQVELSGEEIVGHKQQTDASFVLQKKEGAGKQKKVKGELTLQFKFEEVDFIESDDEKGGAGKE